MYRPFVFATRPGLVGGELFSEFRRHSSLIRALKYDWQRLQAPPTIAQNDEMQMRTG